VTRHPRRRAGVCGGCGALAACLALAACATDPVAPGEPRIVRDHPMTAYDIHEECLRLTVGDRVDYYFSATEPLAFNIHYHEANAVVAPVVREGVRADGGVFAPRIAQDYCLMWEAGRRARCSTTACGCAARRPELRRRRPARQRQGGRLGIHDVRGRRKIGPQAMQELRNGGRRVTREMPHEVFDDVGRDPVENPNAGVDERIDVGERLERSDHVDELPVLMAWRHLGERLAATTRHGRQAERLAAGERDQQRVPDVVAQLGHRDAARAQVGLERELDALGRDVVGHLRFAAAHADLPGEAARGAQILVA